MNNILLQWQMIIFTTVPVSMLCRYCTWESELCLFQLVDLSCNSCFASKINDLLARACCPKCVIVESEETLQFDTTQRRPAIDVSGNIRHIFGFMSLLALWNFNCKCMPTFCIPSSTRWLHPPSWLSIRKVTVWIGALVPMSDQKRWRLLRFIRGG